MELLRNDPLLSLFFSFLQLVLLIPVTCSEKYFQKGRGCEKAFSDPLWGHCLGWFLPPLHTWGQKSSQWLALVQLCYQESLVLWDTWSPANPNHHYQHTSTTHSAEYMHASAVLKMHVAWKLWLLPDESCLSCWVLTHHQDHWFVVEVCILEARRMKVMERIVFLYWQQPLIIKILQLLCHHIDIPQCFRVAPKPPDRHGSGLFALNFSAWKLLTLLRTKWSKNVHKKYYQILTAVCSILQRDI